MRVGGVHTVRPPPTPLSNPDVELLTSWGGSSAPGQGHTNRGLEGGEGIQENPCPLFKEHQHKHHPAAFNMAIFWISLEIIVLKQNSSWWVKGSTLRNPLFQLV